MTVYSFTHVSGAHHNPADLLQKLGEEVVQQVLLRDEERRQPPPNTGAEPSA